MRGRAGAASTDPVRAWRSGNRWFLVQCALGTDKLRYGCAGQRARVRSRGQVGSHQGQGDCMASLACAACIAMRVSLVVLIVRCVPHAVAIRLLCVDDRDFCIFLRTRPCFMGIYSYRFCSAVLLHLNRDHACCHRVTDPAAQRQQGNHEDEEQVTHGAVGAFGFLKVQFIQNFGLFGNASMSVRGITAFFRRCALQPVWFAGPAVW